MDLNVEGMLRMERCLGMDLRVQNMGLNGEVMLRMERCLSMDRTMGLNGGVYGYGTEGA